MNELFINLSIEDVKLAVILIAFFILGNITNFLTLVIIDKLTYNRYISRVGLTNDITIDDIKKKGRTIGKQESKKRNDN